MTCWQLMTLIGGLGVLMLLATFLFATHHWGMMDGGWMLFGILGAVAIFSAGLVSAIVYGSRAAGATTCRHFAAQTGYATKFVVLGPGSTGNCLVRANGRWLDKDNLQLVRIDGKATIGEKP